MVGIGFCEVCLIRLFACEKEGEDYFKDANGMTCRDCMRDMHGCKQCDQDRPYCIDCV